MGMNGDVAEGGDFADFYRRERPKVLAALAVLSREPDAAGEATDEAFARAYAGWSRVSRMASPGGWTYRVALNALRTALRRRAADGAVHAALAETRRVVPERDVELWEVVGSLPDRQRTAIVLRYVGDLSERDIALAMGVRRGTVASTLTQARARLAELLDDREPSQRTNNA
jgi:RNA polymerase sigma-70 factor (ECF subfamily)